MKDRTVLHPMCASSLSARDWIRKGDMVRQDPSRMNSSLMGTLGGAISAPAGRGMGATASHPWGTYGVIPNISLQEAGHD